MKLVLSTLLCASLAGGAAAFGSSAAAPRTPAPAEAYEIDATHSSVIFRSLHVGVSQNYGRFDAISDKSTLTYDAADPSKSSILLVIEAESVDTNNADRDKHLRSGDFFGAKEFPEIVFESKKVSGKAPDLVVDGELTFHGVTKPVSAKVHVVGKADTFLKDHRAGFLGELSIDMADFGVEFVKKSPGAVGPKVDLTVSLECVRK